MSYYVYVLALFRLSRFVCIIRILYYFVLDYLITGQQYECMLLAKPGSLLKVAKSVCLHFDHFLIHSFLDQFMNLFGIPIFPISHRNIFHTIFHIVKYFCI